MKVRSPLPRPRRFIARLQSMCTGLGLSVLVLGTSACSDDSRRRDLGSDIAGIRGAGAFEIRAAAPALTGLLQRFAASAGGAGVNQR